MSKEIMDQLALDLGLEAKETPFEKMKELAKFVKKMQDRQKEINDLQKKLDEANKAYRKLSMFTIPDLFDELGLKEVKLDSGENVSIKKKYAANISEDRWKAALSWLEKNEATSIVKEKIIVKFTHTDNDKIKSKELQADLEEKGLAYTSKNDIHPMTLRAFVREQKEKGSDIPDKTFGIYPYSETIIKS